MVIHGSISMARYVTNNTHQTTMILNLRCISILQPTYSVFRSLRGTFLLLATNMLYAGFFAAGILKIGLSKVLALALLWGSRIHIGVSGNEEIRVV